MPRFGMDLTICEQKSKTGLCLGFRTGQESSKESRLLVEVLNRPRPTAFAVAYACGPMVFDPFERWRRILPFSPAAVKIILGCLLDPKSGNVYVFANLWRQATDERLWKLLWQRPFLCFEEKFVMIH